MGKTYDHFESRECSRCLGTGRYSSNQRDGSTCYGCFTKPHADGSGLQLTPLGRKAYEAYQAANTRIVKAGEVEVGTKVRTTSDGIRTLVAIEPTSGGRIVNGEVQPSVAFVFKNTATRYIFGADDLVQVWTEAIALPPEAEPKTDRKAEMRAYIKACEAVAK